MKFILSFTVLFLLTPSIFSQSCNCADNFAWLKETFEKNDAGFQYAVDQKGETAYTKHSELFAEKVKTITDGEQCEEALYDWLSFFRKGHLWLQRLAKEENSSQIKPDNEKIKKQFEKWETYSYNEKEFKAYLAKLKEPGLEGIWTSAPYTIGVRKIKDEYIGFVLEADGIYWTKTQVKFKIRENGKKLSATYYMQNHSASEIPEVTLLGNNYLLMDFALFKRKNPEFVSDKNLDRFFKFQSTQVPLFEKLSDKTCILRIPSFDGSAKKMIDSLITISFKTISSTENLIIDLQNNGGGSDGSYAEISPLLYTNPIRVVGVEMLSTPLNNKRMEGFVSDPEISEEDKKWAKQSLAKLKANIGKFVSMDSNTVSIETYDTIYPFPKKVGIIINGGCGSTTEQFLLEAKQSKKVKLFGTSTFGSLDISNMYSVKSPCNDFELGYCLSKSKRIPEFTIDGKGIQPDILLDKTIPKYEWIEFVQKILQGE